MWPLLLVPVRTYLVVRDSQGWFALDQAFLFIFFFVLNLYLFIYFVCVCPRAVVCLWQPETIFVCQFSPHTVQVPGFFRLSGWEPLHQPKQKVFWRHQLLITHSQLVSGVVPSNLHFWICPQVMKVAPPPPALQKVKANWEPSLHLGVGRWEWGSNCDGFWFPYYLLGRGTHFPSNVLILIAFPVCVTQEGLEPDVYTQNIVNHSSSKPTVDLSVWAWWRHTTLLLRVSGLGTFSPKS